MTLWFYVCSLFFNTLSPFSSHVLCCCPSVFTFSRKNLEIFHFASAVGTSMTIVGVEEASFTLWFKGMIESNK